MKTKRAPIVGLKAGPGDGLAEGQFFAYPATFTRVPDSYGDVIAKGAFADSIRKWKESGDVLPGMYLHDPNQIVAYAVDMGEDDHGWWVKGQFDEDPAAQRIYKLLKGRRLSSLSFAYDVIDEGGVELDGGLRANELRQVNVHEYSFLPKGFAANADTSVVAVKAADDITELREKLTSLEEKFAALAKDSGATAPDGQDEASAASAPADEEPVGAKSDEASPQASVNYLAAQAHIYALTGAEGGSS